MKTSTIPVTAGEWLLIDAEGQSLGRLAAEVASVLRGKHKPSFSPHQLCGDHVIVLNVSKLNIHPTKLYRKQYQAHTGYLGHLKTTSLGEMLEKKPTVVVEKAVAGMLPANRLRKEMLKRLHVFAGSEHPHEAQKPVTRSLS